MKVKDLIEELSKLNPQLDVIIGKDREGNEHSPCDGVQQGQYTPTTTWYGEWVSIDHYPEEGYVSPEQVNAVVLYPVN